MKRTAALAVIAMLILGACTGKERTMTGAYGSGVLTGQVIMTEGVSVDGVNVSIIGTGMSTRLAADGQFVFAGVPESAELAFQRPADGIDAKLRLDSASGHVVVELTKTEAKKANGRRRAAGSSKQYQFEGLVESATATQVVVNTSKGEQVTITLTEATLIRRGNTTLTAADLVQGQRVHVKAIKTADGFTAVQVIVQGGGNDDEEDDDRPAVREYEGTVVSASATQLVVFTSKKVEETFVITATTDIRKGNTPVLAADIKPGWRVHVKATTSEDGATKTAQRVIVQKTK